MPLAAALPNDIAALKKLVLAQAADIERTGNSPRPRRASSRKRLRSRS
jgi:hypothetical protein